MTIKMLRTLIFSANQIQDKTAPTEKDVLEYLNDLPDIKEDEKELKTWLENEIQFNKNPVDLLENRFKELDTNKANNATDDYEYFMLRSLQGNYDDEQDFQNIASAAARVRELAIHQIGIIRR